MEVVGSWHMGLTPSGFFEQAQLKCTHFKVRLIAVCYECAPGTVPQVHCITFWHLIGYENL